MRIYFYDFPYVAWSFVFISSTIGMRFFLGYRSIGLCVFLIKDMRIYVLKSHFHWVAPQFFPLARTQAFLSYIHDLLSSFFEIPVKTSHAKTSTLSKNVSKPPYLKKKAQLHKKKV
jgi:hypothetical protein